MLETNKKQPGYGRGVIEISQEELNELEFDDSEKKEFSLKMGVLVKQSIESSDFKPPLLPEVALSLTEMANKPNIAINTVESTVSRDPSVAARVVAIANSALYNRGGQVRSLKVAITRIGLAELRDIAFQTIARTHIFRVQGFQDRMRELLEAAQASGLIARKVCQTLRFESELAYLCGLLHDMGEAIILGIVGNHVRGNTEGPPTLEEMEETISTYHTKIGAKICTMWGLPDMIADAVLHHHSPTASNNPSQMATIVAVTDILIRHAGIGTEAKKVDPLSEPLFYSLNLTFEQVTSLLEFAEELKENTGEWCV